MVSILFYDTRMSNTADPIIQDCGHYFKHSIKIQNTLFQYFCVVFGVLIIEK